MAGPSGDPIPTITEAAATGAVKATYEDIRDSLNIGVVNLIWRHFATSPAGIIGSRGYLHCVRADSYPQKSTRNFVDNGL